MKNNYNLIVQLGRTPVKEGDIIPITDLTKKLRIHWDNVDNRSHTVVLTNLSENKYYYIKTNVTDVGTGDTLLWERPKTPGTYKVELLKNITTQPDLNNADVVASVTYSVMERGSERLVDKTLDLDTRKSCSCLISVAEKQSNECLKTRNWGESINGHKCYDPYSVCGSRLKRLIRGEGMCVKHANLDNFTNSELVSLALLEEIKLPPNLENRKLSDNERKQIINIIKQYSIKYNA